MQAYEMLHNIDGHDLGVTLDITVRTYMSVDSKCDLRAKFFTSRERGRVYLMLLFLTHGQRAQHCAGRPCRSVLSSDWCRGATGSPL